MHIRLIGTEDSEAYYALRVQSEKEFPEFVGFSAERELTAGAEGITSLLAGYAEEGTFVWGAFHEQALVGVMALSRRPSPKYRHKAFLWGMYVSGAFRRAGVANRLFGAGLEWAKQCEGIMAIWLQVTLSNTSGQEFYRRRGFSIFGTEQASLLAGGQYHTVHYMELWLAPNKELHSDVPAAASRQPGRG